MKNMKRILLSLVVAAGIFTACDDDDEVVEVKDYGLKTFTADLAYDASIEHDEGTNYTQQTYFAFGEETAVSTALVSDSLSWTEFNIIEDTTAYNVTSDVENWDLVFTHYTTRIMMGPTDYLDYGVTGTLLNLEENLQVAMIEDTVSTDLSAAFADLALVDVADLEYSPDVDVIGYNWKSLDFETYLYTVSDNWFYIIRKQDDTYKLRFTSFYGSSTDERQIKMEYQLMQ